MENIKETYHMENLINLLKKSADDGTFVDSIYDL